MKYKFLTLSLLFSSLFYSCSKDSDETSDIGLSTANPIEFPALRGGANDLFVSHSTSFKGQELITFSMEYDKSKKHARWIAFRYDNRSGQTNVQRSDEPFAADPDIPAQYQRVQADFGAKGYNRGHICASADRLYSEEANVQTFYYSNMSPQKYAFNTGIWLDLEGYVRNWGRSNTFRDTLYVVKGAALDREDQIQEYIGNDRTKPVPKYYFMALLCAKNGAYKAIGFWVNQFAATKPTVNEYVKSIDELEELTGLDFFPALPDKLENAVESQKSTTGWTGLK